MPGLLDFVRQKFQIRYIVSKSANYTLLAADEGVIMTGASALTFTLPGMDTLGQTVVENKLYMIQNNGTANLTVSAGNNSVTGVAQTIAGRSSIVLYPNEFTVVYSQLNKTDWNMLYPSPVPAFMRNNVPLVALTVGTTPQNVVDANGSPVAGVITGVFVIAQDATAGNIIVKNGGATVVTIAKGTTAGALVGDAGLANTAIAAGNALTVESSSAGNARVVIHVSTQGLSQTA